MSTNQAGIPSRSNLSDPQTLSQTQAGRFPSRRAQVVFEGGGSGGPESSRLRSTEHWSARRLPPPAAQMTSRTADPPLGYPSVREQVSRRRSTEDFNLRNLRPPLPEQQPYASPSRYHSRPEHGAEHSHLYPAQVPRPSTGGYSAQSPFHHEPSRKKDGISQGTTLDDIDAGPPMHGRVQQPPIPPAPPGLGHPLYGSPSPFPDTYPPYSSHPTQGQHAPTSGQGRTGWSSLPAYDPTWSVPAQPPQTRPSMPQNHTYNPPPGDQPPVPTAPSTNDPSPGWWEYQPRPAGPMTPPPTGTQFPPNTASTSVDSLFGSHPYGRTKPTFFRLFSNIAVFLFKEIPKEIYVFMLLRLPALYFSRVSRIFEEADMTLGEIKKMALESAASNTKQEAFDAVWCTPQQQLMPPAYESLKNTWEAFIDSVMREWNTFNIISVLLLSAILTILQIDAAAADAITRYTALGSLICALMSLLYGCMYIIRFGGMRKPYKAAEWALEAQKSRTSIFWNVWVMLAMPAVWLSWSLILYIGCIMSFVWRTTTHSVERGPLGDRALLAVRIAITVLLGLGMLHGALILLTFRRYGDIMDNAWKKRIKAWITPVPQPYYVYPPSDHHFAPRPPPEAPQRSPSHSEEEGEEEGEEDGTVKDPVAVPPVLVPKEDLYSPFETAPPDYSPQAPKHNPEDLSPAWFRITGAVEKRTAPAALRVVNVDGPNGSPSATSDQEQDVQHWQQVRSEGTRQQKPPDPTYPVGEGMSRIPSNRIDLRDRSLALPMQPSTSTLHHPTPATRTLARESVEEVSLRDFQRMGDESHVTLVIPASPRQGTTKAALPVAPAGKPY